MRLVENLKSPAAATQLSGAGSLQLRQLSYVAKAVALAFKASSETKSQNTALTWSCGCRLLRFLGSFVVPGLGMVRAGVTVSYCTFPLPCCSGPPQPQS